VLKERTFLDDARIYGGGLKEKRKKLVKTAWRKARAEERLIWVQAGRAR